MEMIDRRIGSWILERELGRGGMGAVFLGRHAKLGTPAAVKALALSAGGDADLQQRFEREAEVHAGLRHPHVARVHDFLEEDGTWFLVMEYLPGGSLAELPAAGPSPVDRAVSWIRQALAGLGHAHSHGVVHRDVKPANLMLDEHGRVKVSDFGIARSAAGAKLTCTGTTLGTVLYMSPEQLEAPDTVDHRTDLYAAGAVLYELLAGEPPFTGESASQVLRTRLLDPAPPALTERRADLDPRLAAVVEVALAPDPEDRPADAEELRRSLAPFEAASGGGGNVAAEHRAPAQEGGTVLWSAPEATRDPFAGQPSANPLKRRRLALAAAALVAALAVAGLSAYHFSSGDRRALEEQAESDEVLKRQKATEAQEMATQAVAAAGDAREAVERARRASTDARSAFDRVVATRDPAGAARAVEDSGRAAQAAGEAARTAADAAERAGVAAASAGRLAGEVRALMVAQPRWRAHPGQGFFVLATIPPAGSAGSDSFTTQADEAAKRAAKAADEARGHAEQARIEAESARRSATESQAAVERLPSPAPGGAPGGAGGQAGRDRLAAHSGAHTGVGPQGAPPGGLPPGQGGGQAPGLSPPSLEEPPDQPTVAVLAPGDPVFGAPLEETLGERLRRAGFDVQDPRAVPGVDRRLRDAGGEVDPQVLGRLLAEDGFHVMVVAPVEIADRDEWRVGGSEGSLSLGQVRLNAYLLTADRRLGRGWREKVEYTELNAAVKAEQALIGATGELVGAIREGWSGYRERVASLRGGGP